jgi:hypothetical protein
MLIIVFFEYFFEIVETTEQSKLEWQKILFFLIFHR